MELTYWKELHKIIFCEVQKLIKIENCILQRILRKKGSYQKNIPKGNFEESMYAKNIIQRRKINSNNEND